MCGIVGIIDLEQPVELTLLKRMTDIITHRGPDEEGFYIDKNKQVGLGFRRLSIIDLKRGSQPMANEDESIRIVFNGEIYNYLELRSELKRRGHRFHTETDTECIIHGYEEFGENIFSRLNGMFAVALWDERKKRLLLARDRAGEKPLHYFFDGQTFLFASEIKSLLLHPAVEKTRAIDWEALDEYFSYGFISAPKTIYKDIKKLEPGDYLIFENNKLSLHTHWRLDFHRRFGGTYKEAKAECARLIEDAVKIRMVSDVPLGAFLSGGVDSSAVVAFMAKHSAFPIKTFSIGFREDDYDERKYARLVARRYHTEHTELEVTADYSNYVEDLLLNFDEPFGDTSALPTHILAKLTREYVTVALSGDGADELFGGYFNYQGMLKQIRRINNVPGFTRTAARMLSFLFTSDNTLGRKALNLGADEPSRFIWSVTHMTKGEKKKLLNPSIYGLLKVGDRYPFFKKVRDFDNPFDFGKQMQYSDFRHYMPDDILVKVDRATMLASLESRAPFLDHRLVEFVFSLPTEWKMKIGDSKIILKDLLEPQLPTEILTRSKRGFALPLKYWLTGRLFDYFEGELSNPALAAFFDLDVVKDYLVDHRFQQKDNSQVIWLLVSFAFWARKNSFI
jgi:asparagine synthase (glutamine-hydrolysing)